MSTYIHHYLFIDGKTYPIRITDKQLIETYSKMFYNTASAYVGSQTVDNYSFNRIIYNRRKTSLLHSHWGDIIHEPYQDVRHTRYRKTATQLKGHKR